MDHILSDPAPGAWEPGVASRVRRCPPFRPVDMVARPRLTDRLAAAGWPPLALAVAPAGFGKTTLLADWAAAAPFPVGWLSVDPDDDDPRRFARGLAAAATDAVPGSMARVHRVADAEPPPRPEALADALRDDLCDLPERLLLVVDDLHLAADVGVLRVLARLLRHPAPTCTLAVGSRIEPPLPLPLARLRARGGVLDVGAPALRFTPDETADLLERARIDPGTAAEIAVLAEGWPAAVRFFAAACGGGGPPTREALRRGGAHALAYLAAEVVDPLPPAARRRLAAVAAGAAVPVDLAGPPDSGFGESMFATLGAASAFVTVIGDGPTVRMCCHPLLRELLRRLPHPFGGADEATSSDGPVLDGVAGTGADAESDHPRLAVERLSHREREVLDGLARRLTDKEIAAELRISPLTVKRHASNLYAKLGVSGRRQAARWCRELGLTGPGGPEPGSTAGGGLPNPWGSE